MYLQSSRGGRGASRSIWARWAPQAFFRAAFFGAGHEAARDPCARVVRFVGEVGAKDGAGLVVGQVARFGERGCADQKEDLRQSSRPPS